MGNIELVNINNNDWTEIQGFSSKGRRVKSWYERVSTREVFLYKEPKVYLNTNFVTKEIWTEYIAYKLGTFLSLDIPQAMPATVNGNYGILIKSFLERGEAGMSAIELTEARDVLYFPEIPRFHNIGVIKYLLNLNNFTDGTWIKFKQMLIFDALIGNNDRHDENWGILYDFKTQKFKLAPIYDNASCLTSGENETRILELLNNESMLERYIINGRPPNLYLSKDDSTHYKHFEIIRHLAEIEPDSTIGLISDMVKKDYLEYTKSILAQIKQIDVPEIYQMSNNRLDLIYKILEIRKQKLEEIINEYV